jgi:hypothetical protein
MVKDFCIYPFILSPSTLLRTGLSKYAFTEWASAHHPSTSGAWLK